MIKNLHRYALGAVFGLLAMQLAAQPQPYPNKPISLVVPQTAGGTNDIVARLVAPAFGEAIGQILKYPEAWRHLNDEAPIYAREWTDVAMAERLARLYRELADYKIGQKSRLTVATGLSLP